MYNLDNLEKCTLKIKRRHLKYNFINDYKHLQLIMYYTYKKKIKNILSTRGRY